MHLTHLSVGLLRKLEPENVSCLNNVILEVCLAIALVGKVGQAVLQQKNDDKM